MNLRWTLLSILLAGAAWANAAPTFDNRPVPVIDPSQFAGRWYSLTSIPTPLDKNWRRTVENYTPRPGGYDVHTTYEKNGRPGEISSRLFVPKKGPQGAIKAQFLWPFKVDYTIIAQAPDGSWMVGGHPTKKLLFILARQPSLPAAELAAIVRRCGELGYPVGKLQSQEHR